MKVGSFFVIGIVLTIRVYSCVLKTLLSKIVIYYRYNESVNSFERMFLMSSLSNMATSSNEKREQRIMRLRRMFDDGEVATVMSAVNKFGYSYGTIVKWCKDGNIPLLDTEKGSYVVPVTDNNKPKWAK